MKKIMGILGLFLGASLILAPVALAAEFVTPDKDNGDVTLSSTDRHSNLYTAGQNVFINSHTDGDLVVGGNNVTIEGDVEQDLIVAGGNVTVNGAVGGDIRAAGGNVIINSKVFGDVLVAGGTVRIGEKAELSNELYVAGGQVIIDGSVTSAAHIKAGTVTINGTLNSSSYITADQSLTFGDHAKTASIDYKSSKDAIVKDGAQVGSLNYTHVEMKNGARHSFLAFFTVVTLVKALALIIFGLLLLYILPRNSRTAVESMQKRMWLNLGIGVIAIIVVPIVSIILMVTLLGFYIGMLAMAFWLIFLVLGAMTAIVFTGAWINNKLTKHGMQYDWQAVVIGVIAMTVLFLVPFIGPLASFILFMMGFGGILRLAYSHIESQRNHATL